MRCFKCGSGSFSLNDLRVEHVAVDSDGTIHGTAVAPVSCDRCGTSEVRLSLDVDTNVPGQHRNDDAHELEIDVSHSGAIRGGPIGFPVVVRCSCGGLTVAGFVAITLAA